MNVAYIISIIKILLSHSWYHVTIFRQLRPLSYYFRKLLQNLGKMNTDKCCGKEDKQLTFPFLARNDYNPYSKF